MTVDLATLDGRDGFRLDGIGGDDSSGFSVARAGDINGDGLDDLILGAPFADPAGRFGAGESYVVFGTRAGFPASLSLAALNGSNGFRIQGIAAADFSGLAVAGAGDFNGDGLDDLVIGAPFASERAGTSEGETYVVFGSRAGFGATLSLADLDGRNGLQLQGVFRGDQVGWVGGAGDVNGDGFDDLFIGSEIYDAEGLPETGQTFVLFGRPGPFPASEDVFIVQGSRGATLRGEDDGDASGRAIAPAGDVNGDGLQDLIIGAPGADPGGRFLAGSSYVVFGTTDPRGFPGLLGVLDGSDGFRIDGVAVDDRSGFAVAGAGDINGDGLDDIVIGARYADAGGLYDAGAAYVVFGRSSGFGASLGLDALNGSNGFRIDGVAANDLTGFSVAGAGDVNGDGLDDLLIGARYADPDGRLDAGAAYVVFGRSTGFAASLALADLAPADGFRIDGARAYDYTGFAVSAAGDLNGDGFDDLIVGATGVDVRGRGEAGATYVVFGAANPLQPILDTVALPNRVLESATTGTFTGLQARAIDPDPRATVTYQLTDNAGRRFAIDATTGVVTVNDVSFGALDFETDRSHQITVQATSSRGTTQSASFVIAVVDVAEPLGPVSDADNPFNRVAESAAIGTRVGLTARAFDPDSADQVTYALANSAGGRFAIDATTGIVTVAGPLDFESAASHRIVVRASSSGGDAQTADFIIEVTNADDPLGAVTDAATAANRVAESAAPGARVGLIARAADPDRGDRVSYTLTDSAGGRFAIDASTGLVTVAGALDFEAAASHQITVRATSSGGGSQSAQFTIAVSNVAEPLGPLSDAAALANLVSEAAAPGARTGLIARATDPDRRDRVSYALTDSAGGRFAIDAATGLVTVAGPLDFESARSHQITVQATSTGGDSQSAQFTIAVGNADDPLGPLTDAAALPDRVAEDAAIGTRTGLIARATDPDTRDRISYALTDSAGGRFAIDAATGVVTVAGALDFETAASHQITVRATSTGGGSQTAQFVIAVTDVVEATRGPGTPGDDRLTGTAGDDTITPGAGSDLLTGGGGTDIFVFAEETRNGTPDRDTITDFTPGDLLDLGPAQIFREIQVNGDTVLILDADRDQIRLLGLADFDPLTMLA